VLGDRIGGDLRLLRQRRRWRQADLAERAACSQSEISRAERGLVEAIPLGKLGAIAKALGARLLTTVAYQGERLDRLRDERHAELVDRLARWLGARQWLVLPEVSFAIYGERGSIDLLAFHAATHILLVVEVKTTFGDVQETLAVLDRKGRLAPRIAAERGWAGRHVAILLATADTTTNRRTVARLDATSGPPFRSARRRSVANCAFRKVGASAGCCSCRAVVGRLVTAESASDERGAPALPNRLTLGSSTGQSVAPAEARLPVTARLAGASPGKTAR
jgi:transcriptional regulator with XRE-family HTH domain